MMANKSSDPPVRTFPFCQIQRPVRCDVAVPRKSLTRTGGKGERDMDSDDLTERERQALRFVRSRGEVAQSQLWKELDISSTQASRIVSSLVDAGVVERERGVHDGNSTFILQPASPSVDHTLLMAGDDLSPFIGEDEVDIHDDEFTAWILQLDSDDR